MKIGYLGPKGTFTEEAAIKLKKFEKCKLLSFDSIVEVLDAVDKNKIDKGVVPIENSIEGSVGITLDLLAFEYNLCIYREIIIPINHCLITNKGVKLSDIEVICSHPHSLAQCRKFIEKLGLKIRSFQSTAAAAKFIKGKLNYAAIAPKRAAKLYNLHVIQENIQDYKNNFTRFIVVAKRDHEFTGDDKTSIVFSLEDKPGRLYEVLKEFAKRNINLTKIESRPLKLGLGRYIFFLDFEGHRKENKIVDVLDAVSKKNAFYENIRLISYFKNL